MNVMDENFLELEQTMSLRRTAVQDWVKTKELVAQNM